MKYFRTPNVFKWIFHRRIWGFSHPDCVYLTFDDGPTQEVTPWILELLQEHNVKATFFCVGANVKKLPELTAAINSGGHRLGNHTMRHDRGTKTSKKEYFESISEAHELIQSDLFRPPYGRIPMAYTKALRKQYKIVMWTWLSYDYDNSVPMETIFKQARRIKGGDILVVHDNVKSQERLKLLLPELIKLVKDKGLTFEVIA